MASRTVSARCLAKRTRRWQGPQLVDLMSVEGTSIPPQVGRSGGRRRGPGPKSCPSSVYRSPPCSLATPMPPSSPMKSDFAAWQAGQAYTSAITGAGVNCSELPGPSSLGGTAIFDNVVPARVPIPLPAQALKTTFLQGGVEQTDSAAPRGIQYRGLLIRCPRDRRLSRRGRAPFSTPDSDAGPDPFSPELVGSRPHDDQDAWDAVLTSPMRKRSRPSTEPSPKTGRPLGAVSSGTSGRPTAQRHRLRQLDRHLSDPGAELSTQIAGDDNSLTDSPSATPTPTARPTRSDPGAELSTQIAWATSSPLPTRPATPTPTAKSDQHQRPRRPRNLHPDRLGHRHPRRLAQRHRLQPDTDTSPVAIPGTINWLNPRAENDLLVRRQRHRHRRRQLDRARVTPGPSSPPRSPGTPAPLPTRPATPTPTATTNTSDPGAEISTQIAWLQTCSLAHSPSDTDSDTDTSPVATPGTINWLNPGADKRPLVRRRRHRHRR